VELSEQQKAQLLEELRNTMKEINRLSSRAQDILDDLEGKRDREIEARVQAALAALRAKARAKKVASAK
jgi:hypothetical protein